MIFYLLILVCLAAGFVACIPLASKISPPPLQLLIALFAPWMILFFFESFPLIKIIRALYLSFIFGMYFYWTYFETRKKLK